MHHTAVRQALIKDGWTITHDPLTLSFGVHNLYVDLGAERVFAAERDGEQIAVEIKSFVGQSEVADMEQEIASTSCTGACFIVNNPLCASCWLCPWMPSIRS